MNPNGMDLLAPARSALRTFGFAKFLSPFPKRLKSVPKPRVARPELYPGKPSKINHNPTGVVAVFTRAPNDAGMAATSLRLFNSFGS